MSILDFTRLGELDFTKTAFFLSIDYPSPPSTPTPLKQLPETYDRACGAVHFSYLMVRSGTTNDPTSQLREAFFRASLAEFVSMEEALERDLAKRGRNEVPHRISDSTQPLLHIVRELRNLEIHLHSAELRTETRPAQWAGGESFPLNIWLVDNMTVAKFKTLRNAKRYLDDEIRRMVDWFNGAQQHWGMGDLVFRSVLGYRDELIAKYSL